MQQIIESKIPGKTKKIPRFVIRWLSRLVCQDKLNDFLRYNDNATGVELMKNAVQYFDIHLNLMGEENLPLDQKKYIFASNHPLGGLDGICLSAIIGEKYHEKIKYLVNDILYYIEPLQSIFVPINKHGAQRKNRVESIHEALESDNQIITFPAGLCSRKKKGKIEDLEWKKMFITNAVTYQRDVVPVYFDAKNSNFFYRLANCRKKIGIRFNIEMLLLPREMFKNKGARFSVYFGRPITWQTFDSSHHPSYWADLVKKIVYQLPEKKSYDARNYS